MTDGKIVGLHPLYDHNNAFDPDLLKDENAKSIVISGYSMKEAAKLYFSSSELKLITTPNTGDFPDKHSYEIFITRCKQFDL